jgi:hypothetical protein
VIFFKTKNTKIGSKYLVGLSSIWLNRPKPIWPCQPTLAWSTRPEPTDSVARSVRPDRFGRSPLLLAPLPPTAPPSPPPALAPASPGHSGRRHMSWRNGSSLIYPAMPPATPSDPHCSLRRPPLRLGFRPAAAALRRSTSGCWRRWPPGPRAGVARRGWCRGTLVPPLSPTAATSSQHHRPHPVSCPSPSHPLDYSSLSLTLLFCAMLDAVTGHCWWYPSDWSASTSLVYLLVQFNPITC